MTNLRGRSAAVLCALALVGVLAILKAKGPACAAQPEEPGSVSRKPIVFSLPADRKEGWIEGNISFPPGSLLAPDRLRLMDRDGREVAARTSVQGTWHDGSVMLLRIGFRGAKAQERTIWVEWGTGVRAAREAETPEGGPKTTVSFNVVDEAGDMSVKGEVDVGTLVVRVERHAGLYYYWYLFPLGAMLGWLVYRKIRLRRKPVA